MTEITIAKSLILFCCSCQMILLLIFQFYKSDTEVALDSWEVEYSFERSHRRFLLPIGQNNKGLMQLNESVISPIHNIQRRILKAENQNDRKNRLTLSFDTNIGRPVFESRKSGITNKTDFSMLDLYFPVNEPNKCNDEEGKVPYMLIQVHSHFTQKPQRDAIRDTWGRIARDFDRDKQVRLVFLLGTVRASSKMSDKIIHESKLYRDIVVGNFVDTYHNLTLKSLAGLLWTTVYCSEATFLLKADDDMFLNVSNILSLLDHVQFGNNVLGALNKDASVVRKGLWAVEEKIFPAASYPPYCAGNSYVMNIETAHNLLTAVPHSRMVPIEDVYVTGILAKATGRTCQGHPSFPHWYVGPSPKHVCSLLANKLCGIHNVQYEQMYKIFQRVQYHQICG